MGKEFMTTEEDKRLKDYRKKESNWKHWGPYLSERGWGTVREDASPGESPWESFPHDHARSRAYRWNEDGLAGICDRFQYLCFSLALWNGKDPILKERLFGLSGPEGNNGEDVKEAYFYLDSTPTHSYMKMLYKYPQDEYPYSELVRENQSRGCDRPEYELEHTEIFDSGRYFDVSVEFAKAAQDDILIKVTVENRSDEDAVCCVVPQLWFRNTWGWGYSNFPIEEIYEKPSLKFMDSVVLARHENLGNYTFCFEPPQEVLFTENETNREKLYGKENKAPYVKDAFHRYIVDKEKEAVNPKQEGTKCGVLYRDLIPAKGAPVYKLRLTDKIPAEPFENFDEVFDKRRKEADEFYRSVQNQDLDEEEKKIQRQAFAGLLWSKQFYYYDVEQWLKEGPRNRRRNQEWENLVNFDLISMPDKWEYPWYASWDLAFHCIPYSLIDAVFAKRQLTLMTREWYMHTNGQLPAYEWNFSDVNPPVHAWAAWRVYKIDEKASGEPDRSFLEGIFHKLLLNFTWWVNKKDAQGHNIFQGGFLGMDNISIFDRSQPLPSGCSISQSDGTSWMGFFCAIMMKISLELAKENPVYEDSASKFFEHFLRIAAATTDMGEKGYSLWDEEDGFFYDLLHLPDKSFRHLKIRSLVGLLPLLAVETLDGDLLDKMPAFKRRMEWFTKNKESVSVNINCMYRPGEKQRRLMAFLTKDRLVRVLERMFDEKEFLSPYGIRSLSKIYENEPYTCEINGQTFSIGYEPGESQTEMFGGNSNWRGPVWFPINFLIIEALQRFSHYWGKDLKMEFPTGSGNEMTLWDISQELSRRLTKLFIPDEKGARASQEFWPEHVLFYEYFHGDTGKGLGASHQTGWTALVAKLLQQSG